MKTSCFMGLDLLKKSLGLSLQPDYCCGGATRDMHATTTAVDVRIGIQRRTPDGMICMAGAGPDCFFSHGRRYLLVVTFALLCHIDLAMGLVSGHHWYGQKLQSFSRRDCARRTSMDSTPAQSQK